jgi:hypothetical protein
VSSAHIQRGFDVDIKEESLFLFYEEQILMKLKTLVIAMAAVTGAGVGTPASAISFGIDFKGYVTMLNSNGSMLQNSSFSSEPPYFGLRTAVSGHMVLDIGLNGLSGTATIEPITFFDTLSKGRDITFKPVDTLLGVIPENTLLLGNMLFDFGNQNGIPVSIVLDMGNLTTALMASTVGDVIGGVMTAATENTISDVGNGPQTFPMGPVVVATTTWNTTDADTDHNGTPGPVTLGTNPSGVLPLLTDTVVDVTTGEIGLGGSPIRDSGFKGFSPNFDFKEITVTCVNLLASCEDGGIPVPPLPLNPDPLGGLLGGTKTLLKGLGL